MASRPAPTGTGISTAPALIYAPAANLEPLGPAKARASRLQVYARAAAASNSGMHVPRARGAGDQERPGLLPPFDPAGFFGHHGSAARTTTASQGPVFYTALQPPWRPRHLTGTSVLREALKFVTSEHISWCLMDWAETFGWMCNIKSDCASNMISEGIQQFYKDAGIDKSQSAAYRPQSHGKIERVIEYINSTVRTTMAGKKQGWDRIAGAMASAWNALPKSMLQNNCPFYLMFGRRPPNQVDLHPHFPKGTEQHRLKDWVMNNLIRIQDYRRFMAVGLQQHK